MLRPRRFALRLPVRYRGRSESSWHHGVTSSISASGAIIEGDAPASTSPLLVAIDLPSADGCLVGRAHVVGARSAAFARSSRFVITVRRFRLTHRR
jgi:hypothetical protein